MSVELVLGSVKDVLESPVLKQALMDDLEAHLALYGLKPVDLKPAVVRGVRVRRGVAAFTPTYWFLAMFVGRARPAPAGGLRLIISCERGYLTNALIPPRMKFGKLEAMQLIMPNRTVYVTPYARKLEGLRVVAEPWSPKHRIEGRL